MRLKLLGLMAVLFLLSACASKQEESAAGSGSGESSVASSGSSSSGSGSSSVDQASISSPEPGSERDFIINVGDRVFFGYDRYTLSIDAQDVLLKQAAWLRQYPSVVLVIEGHADERGTREYNLALGERRASSMKEFLIAQGIMDSRIDVVSYGKERPAVEGSNEAAWAQNRRAVAVINGR